ncbi:MAG: aminopeptidase P family protein [Nitratireductor sp.]|nr:aminopeptidase P family protein [Nitratireductor sp.]
MALHFTRAEYAARLDRLKAELNKDGLDGILLFAQESMYWLTGYDTFGYCFFQCMIVSAGGDITLLTRAPDLRQAQHTSIVEDIRIWRDHGRARPEQDLKAVLEDLGHKGKTFGIERKTVGLQAFYGEAVKSSLRGTLRLEDASLLVDTLRMVKSAAEIKYIRKAGELADDALDAAIATTRAGADEGVILAAMHSAIFSRGGDYAGNEFIIGSGDDALLCRYKSGRRKLSRNDQLTLEWAGAYRHYHAAMMRTIIVGKPKKRHLELYEACRDALGAVADAMRIGNTFGDMFDAHARTLDAAGLREHRLNACGYSMGASFTPCWMDPPMIYEGNPTVIAENMVLFHHMIIADSDSRTAMTLGRSYVATPRGAKSVSRHEIDLIRC